jgi:hypothetical protein
MTIKYTKNADGHFVCPHCNIVKKNQSTMHYHMKKHINELAAVKVEQYECDHCDKVFLQKQPLLVHMNFKHPEQLKEKTEFVCPFDCDFTSPVKGNCLIHIIRIHFQDELKKISVPLNDTKTICCTICKEEFKSNSAFIYHSKRCLDFTEDTQKNRFIHEFL